MGCALLHTPRPVTHLNQPDHYLKFFYACTRCNQTRASLSVPWGDRYLFKGYSGSVWRFLVAFAICNYVLCEVFPCLPGTVCSLGGVHVHWHYMCSLPVTVSVSGQDNRKGADHDWDELRRFGTGRFVNTTLAHIHSYLYSYRQSRTRWMYSIAVLSCK